MKTITRNILTAGLVWSLLIGINACANNYDDSDLTESVINVENDGSTSVLKSGLVNILTEDLNFNEDELQILLNMKEEEKLARDVYTALFKKWGSQVFSNISKAENTHMSAVIFLLQNYGSEYTQVGDEGVFTIGVYATLYEDLVAKGSESVTEAYKVGALIEELDIKDLIESTGKVSNENIIIVFDNLQKGSRNHLRAFNRQLTGYGLTYTPVYLSQDDYNTIISTPHERGNSYRKFRNKAYCINNI